MKTSELAMDVITELESARETHPNFHSAHEGWAVLREEVDELWDEVRKKDDERSMRKMRAEAVQIAAMALRFIEDVCGG